MSCTHVALNGSVCARNKDTSLDLSFSTCTTTMESMHTLASAMHTENTPSNCQVSTAAGMLAWATHAISLVGNSTPVLGPEKQGRLSSACAG